MHVINPYSCRGQPVSGERLVGRRSILDRLFGMCSQGSHCSIVGLPRLGKTSIAKQCMLKAHELGQTSGYVTLDAIRGPAQAYQRILHETASDDEELGAYHPYPTDHDDAYETFCRLLRARMCDGQRSTVVVDEVDAVARSDFPDAQLFVGRLREIANDRDRYGLSFIFVSRRSLDMIQGAVDCSTLAGLCEVIYVPPLCRAGISALMARSLIPIDESGEHAVWSFTGGHPFLAEVVMCEVVEKRLERVDHPSVEESQSVHAHEFTNHYRQLRTLLVRDGVFNSLCELTVGPHWQRVEAHTVHLLQHYGLLRQSAAGETECMSRHFHDYLALVCRETPTWTLLGQTETQLRNVVAGHFTAKRGERWLENLSAERPATCELLERLRQQQSRERRQFGAAASEDILDFTYINDLRELIFAAWGLFQPILGSTKDEWNRHFDAVSLVRNPAAHFRRIPEAQTLAAETSCKWILHRLDKLREMP
jgi:hypothetical protein